MIKQVLNHWNASLCAELALVIFASVFLAVTIRTLLTNRKLTAEQANVVLEDGVEESQ